MFPLDGMDRDEPRIGLSIGQFRVQVHKSEATLAKRGRTRLRAALAPGWGWVKVRAPSSRIPLGSSRRRRGGGTLFY
jgi:hypothetical protein